MLRKALLLLIVLMLTAAVSAQDEESYAITILHTNDTHAHHLADSDDNGGAARQAAVVNQIRAEGSTVLLLDGGDRFTGTLFHTVYQGQDQVEIMNAIGYDGMALGNHEFDNGDDVLASFVSGVNFPVLAANIEIGEGSPLAGEVEPTAVIEVNGRQIGLIGLVTADTPNIASPGDELTFNDDYAGVVNAAAAELTAQGVDIIIVMTHTGINEDLEWVPMTENVDLVIGGHSHTLLGNAASAAAREYPIEMTSVSGQPIAYVQAGQYTQYLGRLDLEFDAAGLLTASEGDTIFLSRFITPDPEIEAIVNRLNEQVAVINDQPIGATSDVFLTGDRSVCRVEECNLGNLIADAMRAETGAQIAIMNGGGIRADIDEGEILLGEVLTLHPFGNLMSTFQLSGADIVAALENGVSGLTLNDAGQVSRDGAPGRFPQVSGLRFSFDPTLEAGSRIVSVEVENEDGSFSPIDETATYSVATLNFIRTGGDGYQMFADNAINPYDFGRLDYEVTRDFLVANSPISIETEGRITIVNAEVAPRQ